MSIQSILLRAAVQTLPMKLLTFHKLETIALQIGFGCSERLC